MQTPNGFTIWNTGGNCQMYGRNSSSGDGWFGISDHEGGNLPDDPADVLVCAYEGVDGYVIAAMHTTLEHAVAWCAAFETARVHYSSDGEQSGEMTLAELLANFSRADEYRNPEANGALAESVIVSGTATGWHDFGQYTVVMLPR